MPVFDPDLSGVLFLNTTRAAYCTPQMLAFEAALADADPSNDLPYPGDPAGAVALTGQRNEVRPGVVVSSLSGSGLPAEFWAFDPGIVDEETLGVGPCLDTDQARTLRATGTGTWRLGDNDLFGSGTRANAWGDTVRVELAGPTGSWLYLANFRNRVLPHEPDAVEVDYRFAGGDRVVPRR